MTNYYEQIHFKKEYENFSKITATVGSTIVLNFSQNNTIYFPFNSLSHLSKQIIMPKE